MHAPTPSLLETALRYHRAGRVVLPNDAEKKFPVGLRGWETVAPTEANITAWFGSPKQRAIGLRDVEGLDFDNKGNPSADELYSEWYALCEDLKPGLAGRLLLERTPSGGYHAAWECEIIAGNQKLATRPPTPAERTTSPKLTSVTLIETRGKGGQFQVTPSPGYELLRGDWAALPNITPAERQILLDCARALSQADARTLDLTQQNAGSRPGDDYNQHHASDALALLESAGWHAVRKSGDVLYLCRPGKKDGVSASFGHVAPGVLYVFSSNASPFEPMRAYSPFAVYAQLEHNGDYKAAAKALYQQNAPVDHRTGEIVETRSTPPAKPVGTVEYVVTDWKDTGITAAELYHKHFDPLNWTVENVMPESTVLLAGKPKSKKSWFALGIACAVVFGGKALGRLNVRQGRALYLDLESNQRRAKSRLLSIVGKDMERLTNLHIFTKWERGDAAMTMLDGWLDAYPDTTLIVIDVLADFRRAIEKHEQPYAYDRDTIGPITEFADRHRITVLLIHHTRKAKADDVFDEISGSTGLISAVGTALILGRSPNGANEMVLDLRGRDLINDEPLALEWDDYTCQHIITGGAVDAKMGAERRQVLGVFADDKEYSPKDVAAELQKPVNNVQQMIKLLLSEGLLERTGRGKYVRVLGKWSSPDQNDQNHKNHKDHKNDQNGYRPMTGFDSDRSDLSLEADQNQDQNHLAHPDALNGQENLDSDHSDLLYRESAKTLAERLRRRNDNDDR